ncbi:MAG: phosphotransferase family protein [bacterium]|nr:phosphotransferase family protein [bacterium]
MIPGVDLEILRSWMDERSLAAGPIEDAEMLGGGTQNILLRFRRGSDLFVLRRPPLHKRRNSDETMRREARMLGALAGSEVPHPALIAACPEEDVLGAAFYLMEPIDGFPAPTGLPALHAGSPAIRHRMGLSMADGIAALGRVDFQKVGLEGFGRPEGFIERQVPRWQKQLESYSELPGYPGPEIPGIDRVADWLDRHKPTEWEPGILHGDYHLANVLFELEGPELAAIVDWELCTIGDPLLDLGWMLATWPDPDKRGGALVAVEPWEGFPTANELVEQYGEGTDRCLDGIVWYEVLACYKLGIIIEGTHARAFAGKAPKNVGDLLHAQAVGLFERALARIATA